MGRIRVRRNEGGRGGGKEEKKKEEQTWGVLGMNCPHFKKENALFHNSGRGSSRSKFELAEDVLKKN